MREKERGERRRGERESERGRMIRQGTEMNTRSIMGAKKRTYSAIINEQHEVML